jgi:transcriptional regulator with XRE-family HTH domain
MNIGEKIKYFRTKCNLTQKQLAEKVGIGVASIQRYERNELKPNIGTLNKITTALGISINDLCKNENTNIGKNIRRIRKYKKFTSEELGKGIGETGHTIGRYERGERTPSITKLKEIASALGVNLTELLGEEDTALNLEIKVKQLEDYTTDELLAEIKRRIHNK